MSVRIRPDPLTSQRVVPVFERPLLVSGVTVHCRQCFGSVGLDTWDRAMAFFSYEELEAHFSALFESIVDEIPVSVLEMTVANRWRDDEMVLVHHPDTEDLTLTNLPAMRAFCLTMNESVQRRRINLWNRLITQKPQEVFDFSWKEEGF